MSQRTNALADRLEQGARALPPSRAPLPRRVAQPGSQDGRRSELSCITSQPCTRWRSSWPRRSPQEARRGCNVGRRPRDECEHAKEHDAVTKQAAVDLLRRNSTAAAAAIGL